MTRNFDEINAEKLLQEIDVEMSFNENDEYYRNAVFSEGKYVPRKRPNKR